MSNNFIGSLHEYIPQHAETWPWILPKPKKTPISKMIQQLDWSLSNEIEGDTPQIHTLVRYRPTLMAQYRVQSAHLLHLANERPKDDPQLIEEIKKTLKMTMLLKKIYQHIDEPDDVNRAAADQAILETILFKLSTPNTPSHIIIPSLQASFSQQLRSQILNTNLTRLTGIRSRRFILACIAYGWLSMYRQSINTIEIFTNPFFLYLGWIFFLPRLALNLITLSKQFFPTPLLSKEKRELPWHLRLEAYVNLHRRGFELWADGVWFTGGVLLCFSLTGALIPLRAYIIIGMQISDLTLMIVRSVIELNRLVNLKNEYLTGIKQNPNQINPGYLQALEERIIFEKKVSFLMITNNALMVLSLLTLLPIAAALSPVIPLLGALLALATTVRFQVNNATLESRLPRTNLNVLLKHYESCPTPAACPPAQPSLSTLAAPMVITMAPIIFLCITYSPAISILLSISLLAFITTKVLTKNKENPLESNFNAFTNHYFFKPKPIETPVEKPKKDYCALQQSAR